MIKAIIIDLDGTTLPRNWHQISEENRVAATSDSLNITWKI